MPCNYCELPSASNSNEHWSECKTAPDFVSYQAKAELRAAASGPLSDPGLANVGVRRGCAHNHIDRNEPDCRTKV